MCLGEHDEFLFICGVEAAEAWAAVSEMESELEIQGVSSGPVVKIHASLKGAQVWSLVREQRSHKPSNEVNKQSKKPYNKERKKPPNLPKLEI